SNISSLEPAVIEQIVQFVEPLFLGHLLKDPNGKTPISSSKTGIVMVIARDRTFFGCRECSSHNSNSSFDSKLSVVAARRPDLRGTHRLGHAEKDHDALAAAPR